MSSNKIPQTRERQLADALLAIAKANHYMVGIVEPFTDDERDEAEQILIAAQNALPKHSGALYRRYDLALDIVENMRRESLQRVSKEA